MQKRHTLAALALGIAAAACGTGTAGINEPTLPGEDGTAQLQSTPIVGVTWRLTGLEQPGTPAEAPPAGTFTLELRADGNAHLVADCNVCNGRYVLGDRTIAIERQLLACTLAQCPSAPFDTRYAGAVAAIETWEATATSLTLSGAGNRLVFTRSGP